jgi:hypothetical protein
MERSGFLKKISTFTLYFKGKKTLKKVPEQAATSYKMK